MQSIVVGFAPPQGCSLVVTPLLKASASPRAGAEGPEQAPRALLRRHLVLACSAMPLQPSLSLLEKPQTVDAGMMQDAQMADVLRQDGWALGKVAFRLICED